MASTPFDSLDDYIRLPRVEALTLSPDGERVVLTVATLKKDGTTYERSLWAVPADGSGAPRRLTRSAKGEAGAAFTGERGPAVPVRAPGRRRRRGERRAAVEAARGGRGRAAGHATRRRRRRHRRHRRGAPTASCCLPSCCRPPTPSRTTPGCGRCARTRRSRRSCTTTYPVRYWDHDLGPSEPHLLGLELTGEDTGVAVEPRREMRGSRRSAGRSPPTTRRPSRGRGI